MLILNVFIPFSYNEESVFGSFGELVVSVVTAP